MPNVHFGSRDEPSLQLVDADDMVVVRTHSRRSLLEAIGSVELPSSDALAGAKIVVEFAEVGVAVYRLAPDQIAQRSLAVRRAALREVSDVRFAGRVLVQPGSDEPFVYTENLFVKFRDEADPEQAEALMRDHGATVKRRLEYATNAFFAAVPEGTGQLVFRIADSLLEHPTVEYCHPEVVRPRVAKVIFASQWHLDRTTINGVDVDNHTDVATAHKTTKGAGVVIAVIDDGVDIDHMEFASEGKIVAPRDASLGTNDPRPKGARDDHGTACAGVACADGLHGASGVAPSARLLPIRLSSALGSQNEADAFVWAAANGADIISCSWGPRDGKWWDPQDPQHYLNAPLPASTKLALRYAVQKGRGGLGCVIMWAAGNGNESVDLDGYARDPQVVAVAACNDQGKRSVYSDTGNALWCAFPSNDFGYAPFNHPPPLTPGIWTTDRLGRLGYNPGSVSDGDAAGHYTSRFGGTSSACPGAAGVAALVLAVNPGLRWNEVKDVLRHCCDRIDSNGGNYDAAGHSRQYGYGRLNAHRAVLIAQSWPSVPNDA